MVAGNLYGMVENYLRDILQPDKDKWGREYCLNTSYYFSHDGTTLIVHYHLRLGNIDNIFETRKSFYCSDYTDIEKEKKEIEDWLNNIARMANAYRKIF